MGEMVLVLGNSH